jgi:transcriptional regulator with XRE-family HTH domain
MKERAERNDKIRQLREEGLTLAKIGDIFGLSKQRIHIILKGESISVDETRRRRVLEFPLHTTHKYAAEKLGMTPSAISYIRNKYIKNYRHQRNKAFFETRFEKGRPNECWIWEAAKNELGYGLFNREGFWYAHRASYSYYIGEIPDKKFVLHTCDNPPCINPAHLIIGDAKENIKDAVKKRRFPMGEKISTSKLTKEEVILIRVMRKNYKITHKELAKLFGVHKSTIARICSRKAWKHI